MRQNTRRAQTRMLTELAVLSAIIIVLQSGSVALTVFAGITPVSLVLIPIVLGAVRHGSKAGAFLGFVFGVITLIWGIVGADAFTNLLFSAHPVITSLLCLVKSTVAGFVSGLLYKLLKSKNQYLALYVATILAPTVNTGIFILGGLTMLDTLKTIPGSEGMSIIYFLVVVIALKNYIFELLVNILFAPALKRVLDILTKKQKTAP